jgi:hypothetical protein
MNFITHNRAFSIHPRATFIERRSLVYDLSPKSFEARMKYVFRGWNQVQYPQATDYADPLSSFGRGPRRVGDRKCWTINLDPTVSSHEDYINSNTWSLQYSQPAPVDANTTLFATHSWMPLTEKNMYENAYFVDMRRYIKTQRFIELFRRSESYGKG